MARPVGVDLFAGAGGMSLGFEQAGFDIVAAVEIDPVHAAVHKFNFPNCAVVARSISHVSGADIRAAAGIGNGRVDVVFGGAPCQGFSLIGHRALDDPRNVLVREFVRVVAELDAAYFVFENVKGITVGKHKGFLRELIEAFDAVGYDVRLPWKVLNAAHYGTPQSRERLILLGAKRGQVLASYPAATTRPAGTVGGSGALPEGPSCRDALGDLPNAEDFDELLGGDVVAATWGEPSEYARKLRGLSNFGDDFTHPREWEPALLTSSNRTVHSVISRRRFAGTAEGEVEPISRFFKLASDGVSNTLRAGTDSARGAFTSPRPIHYLHPRCVTVREMARLHGFPDWFRFHVTKWHGARQIGNAVPPPLAKAVATMLTRAMAVEPERPRGVVELGSEALLSMDVSAAAQHFGVANPIGRRDMKSGARKRKQEDIERGLLAAE